VRARRWFVLEGMMPTGKANIEMACCKAKTLKGAKSAFAKLIGGCDTQCDWEYFWEDKAVKECPEPDTTYWLETTR
jgi:hypothetical protein